MVQAAVLVTMICSVFKVKKRGFACFFFFLIFLNFLNFLFQLYTLESWAGHTVKLGNAAGMWSERIWLAEAWRAFWWGPGHPRVGS